MNQLLVFCSKIATFLPYCIGIGIGVLATFYPTLISRFSRIQPDPGDTRFVNYILEHSFQVLVNKDYVGELWSPPFFFPLKNVLAFSENMFGSAPIYWLFRALFDSVLAFQFWMITVVILCFICFALLMRHYKVNSWLAAFGAFLFAFGMPRVAQLGHEQLLPQFFTPLAFLFIWDFTRKPTNKRLILALSLIYFQLLSTVYLGWFLLFSTVVLLLVVCSVERTTKKELRIYIQKHWTLFVTSCVVWSILVALLFLPYIKAKQLIGGRPYSEVIDILPEVGSWLRPIQGSLWWPLLSSDPENFMPWPIEHHLFLGFTVLLLTLFSIYVLANRQELLDVERRLLVKTCLLVAGILFILSIRIDNFSLWWLIYKTVPGASAIRAVTRIALILYFYLLIAVLVCFDSYIKTIVQPRFWRAALIGVLCLVGVCEQVSLELSSFDKTTFSKVEREMQELMQQGCDVAYVSLSPVQTDFLYQQISVITAGIRANVPVVNGYSGWTPPGYDGSTATTSRKNLVEVAGLLEEVEGKLCLLLPTTLSETERTKLLGSSPAVQYMGATDSYSAYVVPIPLKTFAQAIAAPKKSLQMKVDAVIKLPVYLRNTSNFIWSSQAENPVVFSYHWLDVNEKVLVWDGERTDLPSPVPPQASISLNATIKAPDIPGKYTLRLTMVQEGVAWFDEEAAKTEDIVVTVVEK